MTPHSCVLNLYKQLLLLRKQFKSLQCQSRAHFKAYMITPKEFCLAVVRQSEIETDPVIISVINLQSTATVDLTTVPEIAALMCSARSVEILLTTEDERFSEKSDSGHNTRPVFTSSKMQIHFVCPSAVVFCLTRMITLCSVVTTLKCIYKSYRGHSRKQESVWYQI